MSDAVERGRKASIEGFANEHIVVGILMKRYQNVSLVDLSLSPYDIIIVIKDENGKENIIRAQVKTANKSVGFTGGSRGELTGHIAQASRRIGSLQLPPTWSSGYTHLTKTPSSFILSLLS